MKFGQVITALSVVFLTSLTMAWSTPVSAGNSKYAAIVIHADTGDILLDKYADQKRYPASLTKMMTLYLLFEELEAGRLTMQSPLKVSAFAAGQPPSKLGLKAGSTITVETAINALIIDSSNDVAVVVAERIGGSESKFAKRMTSKAWSMGMRSTTFRNASGLPDRKQTTTARDLATLAKRLMQDFPQYYAYFSRENFSYNGVTHKTHNRVTGKLPGAGGMKTGYTKASGYNLATAVDRDGQRLIGIVLGGRSSRTRDAHMIAIIEQSYATIEKKPEMLAAFHSLKPIPSLKPSTLASLGGVWPPEGAVAFASASPSIADNADMRGAIMTASLDFTSPDGLTTEDDIEQLINMTEAERLNYQTLRIAQAETIVAQGDLDYTAPEKAWSIQIGAFKSSDLAQSSLADALTIADEWVADGEESITPIAKGNATLYRTRINYLTDEQAEEACSAIISTGRDCFTLRDRDLSDG